MVSVITILLLVEIAVQFEYVTSINPMHSNGRFVTFSHTLLLLEGVRNGNEGWGTRSKKKIRLLMKNCKKMLNSIGC